MEVGEQKIRGRRWRRGWRSWSGPRGKIRGGVEEKIQTVTCLDIPELNSKNLT